MNRALVTETGDRLVLTQSPTSALLASGESISPPTGIFPSYATESPIVINNGTDVEISAKTFQDIHDEPAIRLESCTNIYIHNVDFDDVIGGIYILTCDGTLRIEDVRARNIGDGTNGGGHSNIIQLNQSHFTNTDDGITGIRRVVGYGGNTEDMISVYQSGGDSTHPLIFEDIHLESPLPSDALAWSSGSGSGMLLADGGDETLATDIWLRDSTFLNVGQVGIGIYRGTRCRILDCIIYGAQRASSNVGIYTPYVGSSYTGNNEVSGNRVFWLTSSGTPNSLYDPEVAGTTDGLDPNTNTFEDGTIDPDDLKVGYLVGV